MLGSSSRFKINTDSTPQHLIVSYHCTLVCIDFTVSHGRASSDTHDPVLNSNVGQPQHQCSCYGAPCNYISTELN